MRNPNKPFPLEPWLERAALPSATMSDSGARWALCTQRWLTMTGGTLVCTHPCSSLCPGPSCAQIPFAAGRDLAQRLAWQPRVPSLSSTTFTTASGLQGPGVGVGTGPQCTPPEYPAPAPRLGIGNFLEVITEGVSKGSFLQGEASIYFILLCTRYKLRLSFNVSNSYFVNILSLFCK